MAEPEGVRKVEAYVMAHALAVRIHDMTMRLPRFELYEEGSQVRKSSKSVSSQIVEGYRLRKYRNEFLHYLHRAAGSADENREHLDFLFECGTMNDESLYRYLL